MAVASSCGGFFIHRLFYVLPIPLNRITAETDNTRRFGLSNLKYDKNGNITDLTRGGHLKEMPDWDKDNDFGTMDQLDYQYFDGSNRLRSVTDGILKNDTSGKGEFVDGNKDGDDYVYDPNGNMTQDLNKGIKGTTPTEKGIEYNHLNLPTLVRVNNDADVGTISYIYDATGVKLRKNVLKQGETTPTATDYAGNYIYENGDLQFFSHGEGYIEPKNPDNLDQGYDYIYQYTDHLGNIRLSYKNVGTTTVDLEIQEENNYYPFGLKHKGYNTIQSAARDHTYGYNGVEYEESLGLNLMEMDLRQYDPAIGRWTSIDPITHHPMSTYTAFDNNPVFWSDPSGADSQTIYDFDGNAWMVDCENGECDNARRQDENGNDVEETKVEKYVRGSITAIADKANELSGGELAKEADDDTVTAYQLFYQWVHGTGKNQRTFTAGSIMGQQMLQAPEVLDAIRKIRAILDQGFGRSLGEEVKGSPLEYIIDFYKDVSGRNPARGFHGSFAGNIAINNVKHMKNGYIVNMTISMTDYMSAASGTRASPIVGGYDPDNPATFFPQNNPYGPDGPLRTIDAHYNITINRYFSYNKEHGK